MNIPLFIPSSARSSGFTAPSSAKVPAGAGPKPARSRARAAALCFTRSACPCWDCWELHWIGFVNGKSPFLMGKSTISMAIFNSFLYVYQRVYSMDYGFLGEIWTGNPWFLPSNWLGFPVKIFPSSNSMRGGTLDPPTSKVVNNHIWLVVLTILKNMSQREGLSHI